jgi:hypothetical protein
MWRVFPRCNAGRLVGYEGKSIDAPVVYTIDRDGRRDEFLFTIPDGKFLEITDVAIGRDGAIGVVGLAFTPDGRGSWFVARLSPDGKRQTVTRVWPYCPMRAVIAADGSLWTMGRIENEEGTRALAEPVLRRSPITLPPHLVNTSSSLWTAARSGVSTAPKALRTLSSRAWL